MNDFIEEHILAIILILFGFLLFIIIALLAYQVSHCMKGHNEYNYHAPIYQKMGSVMMPIGGGYYNDFVCDKYK